MMLHVIVACHNRKELTLRLVRSILDGCQTVGVEVDVTIFDDGSTDGTGEALRRLAGPLRVLQGTGSAYWAKGMSLAEEDLLSRTDDTDSWIVWLNDDVHLDKDAFHRLALLLTSNPESVIVGAMRDPSSGDVTYSGLHRKGLHPLNFGLAAPGLKPVGVDTFNGNLVLVPISVARELGGIDGGFSHAFADIDYGLRCQRLGIRVLLAPGTFGLCPRNPEPGRSSLREDWSSFRNAKGGGNYLSLRRILRRSNARSWPFILLVTYGLWWIRRCAINQSITGK
jgi:GT2 family glycosyltransferase